ncbi:hypothetical protein DFH11DRAFT_1584081 [Phellopilus nigrolimitatus]|nr:hypothetical protein DFH11DRAFT_1584081 [Phellopilus nigrolimitatus]
MNSTERPTDNSQARGSVDTRNGNIKRRRTHNKTNVGRLEPLGRRRLAGRLSSMMSIPVDVFCEIAHYLSPRDILNMARSSKSLRMLLMSKSSMHIWRAAENAIGLPERPSDLSSPQYATLVFDKYCMDCGSAGARASSFWSVLRLRLCTECDSKKSDKIPLGFAFYI